MGSLTKRVVEIHIPSELGYEKIPMAAVSVAARRMGFDQERLDNLKMAVGEAVTNAIEHGNSCIFELEVQIIVVIEAKTLTIRVIDQGQNPIPPIPAKRRDRADNRGWGFTLIKKFMDEVTTSANPQHNEIKMVAYLDN